MPKLVKMFEEQTIAQSKVTNERAVDLCISTKDELKETGRGLPVAANARAHRGGVDGAGLDFGRPLRIALSRPSSCSWIQGRKPSQLASCSSSMRGLVISGCCKS